MKVVVTGGAGHVGAIVSGRLFAAGMNVTVLDRLVYGGESLLGFWGSPEFRFVHGDVRQPGVLRDAMRGADAVVHLAAIVGEPACSINEEEAWSVNYGGTEAALAVARECNIQRFIFISTCSNYGVSDPGQIADENSPLHPLSQYARSKVEAENHVLNHAGNVCALVLRLGTMCGLSPRMRFDLLVSDMARAAVLGDPISVFSPEAWRPFLHIRDAGRAVAHCLLQPEAKVRGKVFNVVGENYQKKGLAELVLKHYPDTRIAITEKKTDPRDYRVSGEAIRRALQFNPESSVEDAFLEAASAIAAGVFRQPRWPGHSAIPLAVSQALGGQP
jgi:nucleoside-diphosphate-sugar epimerase